MDWHADAQVLAAQAMSLFPEIQELARAKYYNDRDELARLIPLWRDKIAEELGDRMSPVDILKVFEKIYRGLFLPPLEVSNE